MTNFKIICNISSNSIFKLLEANFANSTEKKVYILQLNFLDYLSNIDSLTSSQNENKSIDKKSDSSAPNLIEYIHNQFYTLLIFKFNSIFFTFHFSINNDFLFLFHFSFFFYVSKKFHLIQKNCYQKNICFFLTIWTI